MSSTEMEAAGSNDSMGKPKGSTVTFSKLSYEVNDKKAGIKRLVDNVSVELSQGEVRID